MKMASLKCLCEARINERRSWIGLLCYMCEKLVKNSRRVLSNKTYLLDCTHYINSQVRELVCKTTSIITINYQSSINAFEKIPINRKQTMQI